MKPICKNEKEICLDFKVLGKYIKIPCPFDTVNSVKNEQ